MLRNTRTQTLILTILFINSVNLTRAQSFNWVQTFGNTVTQEVAKLAVDQENNIVTVGTFNGMAGNYLDYNQTIPTVGVGGTYLNKTDSLGNLIWLVYWDELYMFPGQLAIGSDSGIYLIGAEMVNSSDTIDIDPGPDTTLVVGDESNWDVFIIKLNGNGEFQWYYRYRNTGLITRMELGPNDEIYMFTAYEDSLDIDPGPAVNMLSNPNGSNYGIAISKISNAGSLIWERQIAYDSSSNISLNALELKDDQLLFAGRMNGSFAMIPGSVADTISTYQAGPNETYLLLLSLDTAGNFNWARQFSGSGLSNSGKIFHSIVLDSSDNIYLNGYIESEMDFDPDPLQSEILTPPVPSEIEFVLKLDPNGNFIWVKHLVMNNRMGPKLTNTMFIDNYGYLYYSGSVGGYIDFDFDTLSQENQSVGSYGMFVSKIDLDGNYQWVIPIKHISGTGDESHLESFWVDNDKIYLTGQFHLELDFDVLGTNYPLTAGAAQGSIFLARYDQDLCAGIPLDSTLSVIDDTTLMSNAINVSYQWIDCGTNNVLPGETNQLFYASQNGSYAVVITSQTCADTSVCYDVSTIGLNEMNLQKERKLMKVVDIMGRETDDQPNTVQFYIYSDGTIEKVFRFKQ